MAGGKVVTAVENAVGSIITDMGFDLVDVEYVKEGPNMYLRLYVDKKGGIGIDDCAAISEATDPVIENLGILNSAYIFEVSSPGLERPLKSVKDFARYEGETVDVALYAAADGVKQYRGVLMPKEEDYITIRCENGEVMNFAEKSVAVVKRAIIF